MENAGALKSLSANELRPLSTHLHVRRKEEEVTRKVESHLIRWNAVERFSLAALLRVMAWVNGRSTIYF